MWCRHARFLVFLMLKSSLAGEGRGHTYKVQLGLLSLGTRLMAVM